MQPTMAMRAIALDNFSIEMPPGGRETLSRPCDILKAQFREH
jgi:hypothetical protein